PLAHARSYENERDVCKPDALHGSEISRWPYIWGGTDGLGRSLFGRRRRDGTMKLRYDMPHRFSIFRPPVTGRRAMLALAGGLWAAFAGGCASIPNTQFLKERYATETVELKNAWGPIPERTSAAVMTELKRKAGNLDI